MIDILRPKHPLRIRLFVASGNACGDAVLGKMPDLFRNIFGAAKTTYLNEVGCPGAAVDVGRIDASVPNSTVSGGRVVACPGAAV